MLNRYPLWKYILILFVVGIGLIYATPNLYPPDPAIQITPSSSGDIDSSVLERAKSALDNSKIDYFDANVNTSNALIRFNSLDDQLKAQEEIKKVLSDDFVIALNMAETTPDWLVGLGAKPMTKGLDLSGGVHFLMEVDMEKAISGKLVNYVSSFKRELREEKIRYRRVELKGEKLILTFRSDDERNKAKSYLQSRYREFLIERVEQGKNFLLTLVMNEQDVKELQNKIIGQNLITLRNRVNELGVSEPLVQKQGYNRIVVELPGVQDTALAKKVLGKAANLEFRLEALPDVAASDKEAFKFKNSERRADLESSIIVTGENVSDASIGYDESGLPQVNISLDGEGGARMSSVTRKAVKRRMGVLFVENKQKTIFKTVNGETVEEIRRYDEKRIINLAVIQSTLGNSFRITGLDSPADASELALLLRAGALAAPMYYVEERTVGPSLGQENIKLGFYSVMLGFALVLAFMLVFYRVFGIYANIALGLNLVLLIACMSILGATLTLPGIAGIVLTVGMAVDANVLIFSRIKEELKAGTAIQQAIHAGYERAFVTIMDANVTTLIAALILFAVGNGPVKGFAITLSIGILTSMFTAIVVTRGLVNLTYGRRRALKSVWI